MAFQLCSDITIGHYKNIKPNEVNIYKSIYQYVDRAVLKMPVTGRVEQGGNVILQKVEVGNQFLEGDKVSIKLGYNGNLKDEFTGFVSRINFTSPLEVECEGYSYQLRKKTYLKTFVNIELRDVLKYLVSGTDIVLDTKNIPYPFPIDKLVLDNKSGTEALEKIKKYSENTIKFFFTGNVLYGGLQYLKTKGDVKFNIGWNVIKADDLKYRTAKNQNVTINWIGEKKDGTKTNAKVMNYSMTKNKIVSSVNAGTTGETIVIKSHAITNEISTKQMADAKLKSLSYEGYEGKITAFGIPYCEPGYTAILKDKKYKNRDGNYLVNSTEIKYGMSGFRRIVGIGFKLN